MHSIKAKSRILDYSLTKMNLKLICLFAVFVFATGTTRHDGTTEVDTDIPGTRSHTLHHREKRLSLTWKSNDKLDIIQSQNDEILDYEKKHYKKLYDKCGSGLNDLEKLLNGSRKEIKILQKQVERVNQNIDTPINNIVENKLRDIQSAIGENSWKLEDYTRTSDTKLRTTLETIENRFNGLINQISERSNLHAECKTCDTKLSDGLRRLENHINQLERKITEINKIYPEDCSEVQTSPNASTGIHRIEPRTSPKPFLVWCDMLTQGGGWTYVLSRFNGSQNFENDWNGYKFGFGIIPNEHWMGLENLYHITNSKRYQLLVKLEDWSSNVVYAHYDDFKIGNEEEGYKIKNLGTYSGKAGDCLQYHLGMKFSTYDRDQDLAEGSCAKDHHGGWWYRSCHQCQLTGLYKKEYYLGEAKDDKQATGIHWKPFKDLSYSLKTATMMIKPF